MEDNKKISSNLKTKIVMAISIGLSALILTMVIFVQFKTIDETDVTAIETMRETELRTELESWKTKFEEVEQKLDGIMTCIFKTCNEYAEKYGCKGNYVAGANLAAFEKLANAMKCQGVV